MEPVHLPPIPAKRYFTIGEVSELCGVKTHVLRYWEQEFTQLRPMKRRGNRRYYQHHEVLMIRRIRELLYDQGFTISGARNRLSELATADRHRDNGSANENGNGVFQHLNGHGDVGAIHGEGSGVDALRPPAGGSGVPSAARVNGSSFAAAEDAGTTAAVRVALRGAGSAHDAAPMLDAGELARLHQELCEIRELLTPDD